MGGSRRTVGILTAALIGVAACAGPMLSSYAASAELEVGQAEKVTPPSAAAGKDKTVSRDEAADRFAVQEGRALEFARLHHPELGDLLGQLKGNSHREYRQAIHDLAATSERLSRTREKSPERYGHALAAWRIDSRIRLLAARMAMSEDPALEEQLKALVEESIQVRLTQMRFDQQKAAERADRLGQNIARIEADREAAVSREIARVKKSVKSGVLRREKKPATDRRRPEQPEDTSAGSAVQSGAKDGTQSEQTDTNEK
jgi:hypothetical protein